MEGAAGFSSFGEAMGRSKQTSKAAEQVPDPGHERFCCLYLVSDLAAPLPPSAAMAQHNGTLAFLVCVGGIYASYLTYGYVQEAMFRTQPDGTKFSGTWLLLAIQCAANALVGYAAHVILSATGAVAPPPKTAAPFMSWTSQSSACRVRSLGLAEVSTVHGCHAQRCLPFPSRTWLR